MTSIEERLAVEVRILRDAVDLEQQLRHFGLQIRPVVLAVDVRGRFDREVADTLQDVRFAGEGAERDLRRVVGVLNVLHGLIEAIGLRLQVGRNRETRRVVGGGVNTQTGRQIGDDGLQLLLVIVQM